MESKTLGERLKQYNDIIKENDELYRDAAKKSGLSECEFWILYFLRTEYGSPMQSEICNNFYQPKQSVHSALKKLEADGYIVQTAGKNRRSKQILLTEQGEMRCEKTVDPIIRAEKEAFGSLSEEEREALLSLFGRYTGSLKHNMQALPWEREGIT